VREEHGRSIYEVAEEYYLELIRRNLLQPKPDFFDKGVSRMHDMLRELAQNLTRDHALFLSKDTHEHMLRDHGFFKSIEQKEDELLKLRRLGISNDVEEIPSVENEVGVRSLLLFHSYNLKELKSNIFVRLEHLRIIVFRGINVRRIPDSVGRLVQLRLLDLSYTKVRQLPESIGRLFSLEYLSVVGCLELASLPASLMGLSRLRFLQVDKAITSIPKGIGKFKHLYNLKGVFEDGTTGFTLDELKNLSKVRHLWIERLEKATPRSAMVLSSMVHLKELGLCCTMDEDPHNRIHYQTEQVERIQQVYEKLVPSRKLEYIFFYGFPGSSLPRWLCAEPQDQLQHLGHMHFNECIAMTELPPAGQLPELQVLHVKGADAIRNIGAELLGKGVRMTLGSSTKVFPKLELLHIADMPNWETWSLSTVGLCSQNTTGDSRHQVILMPILKRLSLLHCPKLRALPQDLNRVANLREVRIEGAHSLHEIVDLPVVVWLKVKHNRSLRTIANLSKLEDLFVQDCPALDQAENLGKLKRLEMVDCAKAERFRRCLLEEEPGHMVLFNTENLPDVLPPSSS
jgi:Leucine-rich repeat (LRR) protein